MSDNLLEISGLSVHYPGRAAIETYGAGGFGFAGMSHRGSIVALPSGIYAWNMNPTALTPDDFAMAIAEKDATASILPTIDDVRGFMTRAETGMSTQAKLLGDTLELIAAEKAGVLMTRMTSDIEDVRIGVQEVLFVSLVQVGQMFVAAAAMRSSSTRHGGLCTSLVVACSASSFKL